MKVLLDRISVNILRVSFIGLALCIPFSIAGANISIGIGILGMLIAAATPRGRSTLFRRMSRDPILMASILLVGTGLVSALMSENTGRGLRDWDSYWLFSIYLLTGFCVPSRSFRSLLFWILFASGSMSALVALVQASGGLTVLSLSIPDKVRPSSTLFTMTFAGIFYQLICVNFSMLFGGLKSKRTAAVLTAGLAIQIVAFMFNQTRGALLAMFVGLGTAATTLKKGMVISIFAAILVIILVLTIASPTLNKRFRFAFDSATLHIDRSVNTRLVLWDISLDLIRDHPLFGVGMGDFTLEADRRLEGRPVRSTTDAHNIYLHVLATRGLFGFIPFLLFWVILLRQLSALEKRSRACGDAFSGHLIVGMIAAAAALLAGALTENNIDDSEVFIAFLFLLGLARGTEWDDDAAAGNGQPL